MVTELRFDPKLCLNKAVLLISQDPSPLIGLETSGGVRATFIKTFNRKRLHKTN